MTATAPAKVYFTNLRTHARESQLDKLKRLIRRAGIEQIDFENKFVAIKIHFGELGNLSFLRPNYARAVADVVKELGGKPFLTDCNTLYVGSRKNALEHIDTAYQNGFTPYATGCQIIIADGLKGTDEALVPVEGGEYVHEAKIGQALMDADIVISLTHFKGHEQAGFGGAMKNLGMGGGSRAGKMEQHAAGKPSVDTTNCVGCRACERICAHNAVSFDDTRERELANGSTRTVHVAAIDHNRCVGCGRCIAACNQDCIKPDYDAAAVSRAHGETAQLRNFPIQLRLVSEYAPFLDGASLLIAADCTAFVCPDFFERYARGRVVLIGCPKLDAAHASSLLAS